MQAPYGTWPSSISARMIADTTISLSAVMVDDDALYWLEGRPSEGGRVVLVRDRDGDRADITPGPYSVRSRAHEYGGGAATVADGTVYFVNHKDQRIYRQQGEQAPMAVAGADGDRFADMVVDAARGEMICVRERHADGEVANALVRVDLRSGEVSVLDGAHDFVSTPRVSPDGQRLAWLTWDHPDMPWDGASLWVANRAADGSLSDVTHVAGCSGESVFQPEWHPDGRLIFVSDPKGWWNLCALDNHEVVVLAERHAEFGLPQWVFGMRTYDVLPGGDIVCAYVQDGTWQLACLSGGLLKDIETPYTDISSVRAFGGQVAFIGASAREGSSIVRCDPATGNTEVVARASTASPPASELSVPEAISFETANGATAYGLFYAPQNAAFEGPADERPPLILRGHGGPTGSTSAALSLAIQYWTNRGFAVLDVNYRGSTGFGRAYREALYGQWGVADVEDMVAGANYLVAEGKADPARLAIRGGSAGGYTALAALTFADVFSAGASLYGIGDLMTLARDTHKFESRYLDRLIGPLPEDEAVYLARSPINHVEGLNCPVLFLQGEDDKVVPPNQAEAMVAALDGKGIPVAYVLFSGEGHGFRKAENVTRALEAELAFYGRVFGFVPADDLPGLEIRNL